MRGVPPDVFVALLESQREKAVMAVMTRLIKMMKNMPVPD